jgi:hypothetical protein
VAPVYPWIFTGGIDPYLWGPIPGVQTLDFKPFRVPLTPFAGVLSNGAIAHQIALSVYGANGYFSVAGALMLYLDHGGNQVTGSITQNTLAAQPSPVVTNTLTNNNGVLAGKLDTKSPRDFVIAGTVVTSAGSGQYTVTQKGVFKNDMKFKISNTVYEQDINQLTDTTVKTSSVTPAGTVTQTSKFTYPLVVDYKQSPTKNGDIAVLTDISQDYLADVLTLNAGTKTKSSLDDSIDTTDTLLYTAGGGFLGHQGMASSAEYATTATGTPCFRRTLSAANNVLTAKKTGCKQ